VIVQGRTLGIIGFTKLMQIIFHAGGSHEQLKAVNAEISRSHTIMPGSLSAAGRRST
jgi:hypothetical protein